MAKFMSKYPNLILVMQPIWVEVKGITQVIHPGKNIQFENGSYETEDESEIAFIRGHRWFGSQIVEISAQDQRLINGETDVTLTCDYPDCNYSITAASEAEAKRRLNAHKTKMGHWVVKE